MNETKLYGAVFFVKKIKFEPDINITGKVTVNVEFLKFCKQNVFEPVIRPSSDTMCINIGKLFTFGINHDMITELAKNFVINLYLDQTDPEKQLAKAQIDITQNFCEIFKNSYTNNLKMQVKNVKFDDDNGKTIAYIDMIIRLSLSGPYMENTFNLNNNVDVQYMSNNVCRCPKVPDFKFPLPNKEHDDEGEVDIVCAELNNGQKIAIKYRRCYELKSLGYDKECKKINRKKVSKSEEKLNNRIIGLMEEMHRIIASNATTN